MGRDIGDVDEDILDLGREHVDALDDQHIVGSAHGFRHSAMGSAAGAGLIIELSDILGAVSEHRHTLTGQGGDDQLADFTLAEALAGIGVDDLGQEVILRKMHTVARFTVAGNTGAAQLGHAVVVGYADVEVVLDLLTHGYGARF